MIPKFRAWLKNDKEMIDADEIHWYGGQVDFIGDGITFMRKADEIELMQSTGLKDKNGQEIFEGDIVRIFDSLYTVFYDNEEGSYRLKPHDERWVIDYMSNFSHGGNFEVVGNIYEMRSNYDNYKHKS